MRRIGFYPPCIPKNTRPDGKNERKRLLSPWHRNPPILTPFTPTTSVVISPHHHNSTHSTEGDNMMRVMMYQTRTERDPYHSWLWTSDTAGNQRAHMFQSPHPAQRSGGLTANTEEVRQRYRPVYVYSLWHPRLLITSSPVWTTPNLLFPSSRPDFPL